MRIVPVVLGFLWMIPAASSFGAVPPWRSCERISRRHLHRDLQDLEDAREEFERLLADHEALLSVDVLTTTSRHRRKLEMNLLRSLEDSDDAIEELMHLWMYEHGTDTADVLIQMQEEASPGLVREQAILSDMMESFPTWAEPVVRLATLMYYKGETQQARELAQVASYLKPWHFEAIQLLVMLALRDGNTGKALVIARQKSLPQVGSKRRTEWVDQAVNEAEAQYQNLIYKHSDSSGLEAEVWQ